MQLRDMRLTTVRFILLVLGFEKFQKEESGLETNERTAIECHP